jgi:nicotinate dehydrogenase subunit A
VIALRVNGNDVEVGADPDTPLLYVLRNDLGLMGTRFGCGQGLCGACTVLVDGRPRQSCDTPTWMVAGTEVRTVESLAGDQGRPHPVQQAFLDEQAGQCGYCLSGIVMRTVALLEQSPAAGRDEVLEALDGHLCRCGAHPRIVRAVQRALAERAT